MRGELHPRIYFSAAMKNCSPYRPAKLEQIFLEAVARKTGNSVRNFSVTRKTRSRFLSSLFP